MAIAGRGWVVSLLLSVGCAGEEVATRELAHTTSTPGELAWVRMFGGPGLQVWEKVDSHRDSNLTWVAGPNRDLFYQVMAYDPNGTIAATASYGDGTSFMRFMDFAVSHDDSHTMTRAVQTAQGLGCPPAAIPGWVTEVAHVERDGACRWSYSFPYYDIPNTPRVLVDDGHDGTVVLVGMTHRKLTIGDVVVGDDFAGDLAIMTPAAFAVRLDADGEVLWARDLGRLLIVDMAVDGADGIILAQRPHDGDFWQVARLAPDGTPLWARDLGSERLRPTNVAGSPTGDAVVVGIYFGSFSVDDETFVDAGQHSDIFALRLAAADGAALGGRRLFGDGSLNPTGVAIDPHGRVAIVGTFQGGSINIGDQRYVGGLSQHAFVGLFSPWLASTAWSRAYGDDSVSGWSASFYDVAFTANSRVLAAGGLNGTIDFGGESRTGNRAAVVARLFP